MLIRMLTLPDLPVVKVSRGEVMVAAFAVRIAHIREAVLVSGRVVRVSGFASVSVMAREFSLRVKAYIFSPEWTINVVLASLF